MVLKEKIYGWYPPSKSPWTKPTKFGVPSGYEAECLYGYCKDKSNPNKIRRLSATSSIEDTLHVENTRISEYAIHPCPPTTRKCSNPDFSTKKNQQFKPKFSKPWAMKTSATPTIQGPIPKPDLSDRSYSPFTSLRIAKENNKRPDRIHSAPVDRQLKMTPTKRTVKSAGLYREKTSNILSSKEPLHQQKEAMASNVVTDQLTSPVKDTQETDDLIEATGMAPGHSSSIKTQARDIITGEQDYDTQLLKHGWKMEIPGDPFGYKAPCIKPRLSFTKKCIKPKVKPNAKSAKMEVYDTYFYNTIPRKPLSFTVHPEWVSEVLLAKRIALQKREGLNFKFTNYAFAY